MKLTELEEELYIHLDQLLDYVLYMKMSTKYEGPNEPNLQAMIKTVGNIKWTLRRLKENEHKRCNGDG